MRLCHKAMALSSSFFKVCLVRMSFFLDSTSFPFMWSTWMWRGSKGDWDASLFTLQFLVDSNAIIRCCYCSSLQQHMTRLNVQTKSMWSCGLEPMVLLLLHCEVLVFVSRGRMWDSCFLFFGSTSVWDSFFSFLFLPSISHLCRTCCDMNCHWSQKAKWGEERWMLNTLLLGTHSRVLTVSVCAFDRKFIRKL